MIKVPIYFRSHSEVLSWPKDSKNWLREQKRLANGTEVEGADAKEPLPTWPDSVLVLGCESTKGNEQKLIFGVYSFCVNRGGSYMPVERGIFYRDDLPGAEVETLRREAQERGVPLYCRSEFIETVFWPHVWLGTMLASYDLAFVLTRMCAGASYSKRKGGRWSLYMSTRSHHKTGLPVEDKAWPRLTIKLLDGKGKVFGRNRAWTPPRMRRGPPKPFRALDLNLLAWAIKNESLTLNEACSSEGLPLSGGEGIARCFGDVKATEGLLNALRVKFDGFGSSLLPEHVYSLASFIKDLLRRMNISVPSGLSPYEKGIACQAYFGGRSECRIRRQIVPVTTVDASSEYPTVCEKMNLWLFMVAERVCYEPATEEVQTFLNEVTKESLRDDEDWQHLCAFVLVRPDGLALPRRTKIGKQLEVSIGPLFSDRAIWVALPDLLYSKFKTGRVPAIIKAVKVVAHDGRQPDLLPAGLLGLSLTPDTCPSSELIRERFQLVDSPSNKERRGILKILANVLAYGICSEVNPENHPAMLRLNFGEEEYAIDSLKFEKPGPFYFPPVASLVTAGGRLLLGLLELEVDALGGSYMALDTDAMSIVSTKEGGLLPCVGGKYRMPDDKQAIKALSHAEVDGILAKFSRKFSPLQPDVSVFRLENENFDKNGERRQLYGASVSSKRYCLFYYGPGGKRTLAKVSRIILGQFMAPCIGWDDALDCEKWIAESWNFFLDKLEGKKPAEPSWFKLPVMIPFKITYPQLLSPLQPKDYKRLPYDSQAKPFNSGMMPIRNAWERRRVYASLQTELHNWKKMKFHLADGSGKSLPLLIVTRDLDFAETSVEDNFTCESYSSRVQQFLIHPEGKFLDAKGEPCESLTAGLLFPMPVTATEFLATGKELDRNLERGDITAIDQDVFVYKSCGSRRKVSEADTDKLKERLRKFSNRRIRKAAKRSERSVRCFINNELPPDVNTYSTYLNAAQRLEMEIAK